jgi:DNA-binding SARP family transcriptional activator
VRRNDTVFDVELRLLGPVEVVVGGQAVRLVRRQERCLLAILALELGRFVPVERLADLLWDKPPRQARGGVAAMVSHLRSALDPARPSGVRIRTGNAGYALEMDPEMVDVYRFRALVERGRGATSGRERVRLFDEALGLWRGPALAGAAEGWQHARLCGELDEMHVATREEWLQARLDSGEHRQLVDQLTHLVGEHPLRERPRGQLMLALYRCGRRADALDAYRQARQTLVEELGLEPGPELRALQQAILTDDPALASPVPDGAARVVPAQLPAPVAGFTGRAEHLKELNTMLPGVDPRQSTAVVITAINGTAGVGKPNPGS